MTLRDYFAAKAMTMDPLGGDYTRRKDETSDDYVARRAYEYADAMLRAREA